MQLIETIKDAIRDNYVITEKVDSIIDALDAHEAEFAAIDNPQFLAQRISEVLFENSNDKHFRVAYAGVAGGRASQRPQFHPERNNYFFYELKRLTGNIGYLDLRMFVYTDKDAAETAYGAMAFLAGTDAVIFDLRRNRGGTPDMVRLILSYFYEQATHINSFYNRPDDSYTQSWTTAHVQGRKMSDVPLYVLTSHGTGSAAEEFAYDVQQSKRGLVIGQRSAGAGHAAIQMPLVDGYQMIVPIGKPINPHSNDGWEGVGVQPDIETAYDDALPEAQIHALQTLLENTADDGVRAFREWELETLRARKNPHIINNPELYTGQFGQAEISLIDGQLHYQSQRINAEMIAINDNTFIVSDELRATIEHDTLIMTYRDSPMVIRFERMSPAQA